MVEWTQRDSNRYKDTEHEEKQPQRKKKQSVKTNKSVILKPEEPEQKPSTEHREDISGVRSKRSRRAGVVFQGLEAGGMVHRNLSERVTHLPSC